MSSSNNSDSSLVIVQKMLTFFGYSFLVTIGTLGNLVNIIVFLKKRFRTISCNNYFLVSAMINLIILNVGSISVLYTYNRPWAITITYCKLRSYIFNVSQQISRYLIVAACFDRFALCSKNIRLRQFCRVHIARYYIIPLISIIWLIFPIHMLIFNTSKNNNCIYPDASALYNSIYGISLVGLVPPILMLIFSLLTFNNLKYKQRQQIYPLPINNNKKRKQELKDAQVLAMLIIQVIVYIPTTTISSLNLLYSVLTTYIGISKSNERKSIETFITFLVNMLNYTCPSLSCYLFLFVSRLYRKQLKSILLSIYNNMF